MASIPDSLVQAIRETSNIVLATHINPDGDALGSLLGLAGILEAMGKEVVRYLEEPVSHLYDFLPGTQKVVNDLGAVQRFIEEAGDDILAISLDCGDMQRLGQSGPWLMKTRPFVVIDHHKGNNGFGDLTWIEPHRSSTGEMIYDLACALDQPLSRNAAICLYTAILTDTGSFHYESTSAHTFEVAARLLECGVQPDKVAQSLYDNYTVGRLRLMQLVLATLETFYQDRIGLLRVTRSMLGRTGTGLEDTENFINLARSIATVEVAVFFKETDDNMISVSLRAKGHCDVAKVAARFGGGGHRNAAGFRQSGLDMDRLRDRLLPLLMQELEIGA